MKIRSTLELTSALENALAWRKKEITTLYFQIHNCQQVHIKEALLRATIPILYAHWEGFTKEAAMFYLELVARQRLKYSDLKTNFVALSCRSTLKEIASSNKTYLHTQLVDFLTFNQNDCANIPYSNVIDTESNLSSIVLKNILFTLGLPFDDFWQGKSLAIDGSLLYYRNKIAHGERHDLEEDAFIELHDLVINSLDQFKISIENTAIQKGYKR